MEKQKPEIETTEESRDAVSNPEISINLDEESIEKNEELKNSEEIKATNPQPFERLRPISHPISSTPKERDSWLVIG